MLVAVQSFGSVWMERRRRAGHGGSGSTHGAAYYNTTGVTIGKQPRSRSCIYGVVRLDESSGFRPEIAGRSIHRVYESEGVRGWNGGRRLFLHRLVPAGTRPDAYLFRIDAVESGWIDRNAAWKCDAAQVISFSEAGEQQQVLIVLPPFGWIRGAREVFCAFPEPDRPSVASLSPVNW
jgi:hypothetical protein